MVNIFKYKFLATIFFIISSTFSFAEEQGITLESKSPPQQNQSVLNFSDGVNAKISQPVPSPEQKVPTDDVKNEKVVKVSEKQQKLTDKNSDKTFEKAVTKDESVKDSPPPQLPTQMPLDITAQEKVDTEYIRLLVKDFADHINNNQSIVELAREHLVVLNSDLKISTGIDSISQSSFGVNQSEKVKIDESFTIEMGSAPNWAIAYGSFSRIGSTDYNGKITLILSKTSEGWKVYSAVISNKGAISSDSSSNGNISIVFSILGFLFGSLCSAFIFKRRLRNISK